MIIAYPMENESNYDFDTGLGITAGKFYNKLTTKPAGATFYNTFEKLDGAWGSGSMSGTAIGGASVSGGELDLTPYGKSYVNYDAVGNADSQQTLTIRLIDFKPNYITPSGESIIILINKEYNSTNNMIYYRDTGSHHRLHIHDQNGNLIEECYFGYKQWVVDQPYEIEFNIDITTGAIRMFIDGVQFGATKTSTGIRDGNINLFRIGCSYQDSTNSNFKLGGIAIYDTVQHTADYTPDNTDLPDTNYYNGELSVYLPTISQFNTDTLNSLSLTASTNVRIILKKDTVKYYYTGGAWVVSDGTYSQANTNAELTDSIVAQFTSDNVEFTWQIVMETDGYTQENIDLLSIDYSQAGLLPTINIATIQMFLYSAGEITEGLKVTCKTNWTYGTQVTFDDSKYTVYTDSKSYCEIKIKYEDVLPESLEWNLDGKVLITTFLTGTNEFSKLTRY